MGIVKCVKIQIKEKFNISHDPVKVDIRGWANIFFA